TGLRSAGPGMVADDRLNTEHWEQGSGRYPVRRLPRDYSPGPRQANAPPGRRWLLVLDAACVPAPVRWRECSLRDCRDVVRSRLGGPMAAGRQDRGHANWPTDPLPGSDCLGESKVALADQALGGYEERVSGAAPPLPA